MKNKIFFFICFVTLLISLFLARKIWCAEDLPKLPDCCQEENVLLFFDIDKVIQDSFEITYLQKKREETENQIMLTINSREDVEQTKAWVSKQVLVEYQNNYWELIGKLKAHVQTLDKRIQTVKQKIKNIVTLIAMERDAYAVLSTNCHNAFYVNPKYDITKEVINLLNTQYHGTE